ncbi:FAD/NAD(P)-binding domain-containing protein [Artomyces pyxidatus]|uniref:FAD/NAD(P)-binding domain-containing protein n=1 Tax=Artomyces pyxidatus TaxID=48021 RepID=A0ACB8T820_9AGAM|nr:FAD/NAD(P)-binding domain-containing protein [Artomyces pyxidatus]
MSKRADRQSIVVVGGGGAGALIARMLSAKINPTTQSLTLVTARPFAVHLPAAIRMTTTSEDKLEEKVLIPYDQLFVKGNGKLKVGRVVSIEDRKEAAGGEVVLENGERIAYDVLILAPGSTWSGPLDLPDSKEDVLDHIRSWRRKFENSKSVILAGGGAVGIEYAGEIREFYPRKKVTIVHSDELLLNKAYPNKYRKRIEKDIRSHGVNIVFNDYIDNFDKVPVTTRSGRTVEGDLVIPTFGSHPATEFIASLGSGVLTERGLVRVEPTLQVRGHKNIFAAGDVIEWDEQKQVAKAPKHGEVVVANVLSYLSGTRPGKEYKGQPELIIITNGKTGGIAYLGFLWGITLGNWFSSMMKGKGLMIDMQRKGYGLSS